MKIKPKRLGGLREIKVIKRIPWNKKTPSFCMDCKKKVSARKVKRCWDCYKKYIKSLDKHPSSKLKKTFNCETCNKLTKVWQSRPSPRFCSHSCRAKKQFSGSNHRDWKGGISYLPNYNSHIESLRRARKFKNGGSHTLDQWQELKKKFNYICLCCKQQEPFIKLTKDHIIPLSMGGSDNIDNIQPLCIRCNSRKYISEIDYRLNFKINAL